MWVFTRPALKGVPSAFECTLGRVEGGGGAAGVGLLWHGPASRGLLAGPLKQRTDARPVY